MLMEGKAGGRFFCYILKVISMIQFHMTNPILSYLMLIPVLLHISIINLI